MRWRQVAVVCLGLLLLSACGGTSAPAKGGAADKTLYISGIPDEDVAILTRRFKGVAEYLSQKTGLKVEYLPAADYAAVVAGFKRGDIQFAWFGGLTGVQALAQAPGSEALVQRPRDAEFHSIFIVQKGLPVKQVADLKGLTFTFGSESSTSGHLMPRYYMLEAGVDPVKDLKGPPNFSGSHDTTIKLVESGAFQAGVVNEAVWQDRTKQGKVDLTRVQEFYKTPAYFDYHWGVRGGIDAVYGAGTREKLKQAMLEMGAAQQDILDAFNTDKFVETKNSNYDAIRTVAEKLGILK